MEDAWNGQKQPIIAILRNLQWGNNDPVLVLNVEANAVSRTQSPTPRAKNSGIF